MTTPAEVAAVAAMLEKEGRVLSQEAAFHWVDTAMRRAVGLVRELVADLTGESIGVVGVVKPDEEGRAALAFSSSLDCARLVDTYVSAAIEVASAGIAVTVRGEEEEQAEPEPGDGLKIDGGAVRITGRSVMALLRSHAAVTPHTVVVLAEEARVRGLMLTMAWFTPDDTVQESWSPVYAIEDPEAVLSETAAVFRDRGLALPPALKPYGPGELCTVPYPGHACDAACDPKMVASGAEQCQRCRVNPSLR